ncbi:nucleoside-diphosphate sugar epimerase/dehydratase [Tunicatimonas pelagia]|uniref:nucleoside-diphosphate sugar epimerase/dehydratase n=1 Tax=Tunicatimonas pelagia TaxID=931531 RepID=UPI0026654750|nr:hypothetical protein [Tunicatimonas pelagia]WKN43621.1 hypothetical protein P0M28_01390 [Tunicatimonas pelagia]
MFHIPKYTQYSKTFFLVIMMLDAFCLYFAFDLSLYENFLTKGAIFTSNASFYTIWVLLWIIISLFSNHYNTKTLKRVLYILKSTSKVVLIHALFIFVYLLTTPQYFEIGYLINVYLYSVLITVSAKVLLLFSYRLLSNKQENKVNFIIIGRTSTTHELLRSLDLNQKFGHHFYGFFNGNASEEKKTKDITSEIEEFCKENAINYIYFDSSVDNKVLVQLIKYANNHYIRFSVVHSPITVPFKEVETSVFNNIPVIYGRNFSATSKNTLPGMKKLINSLKA